MLTKIYKIAVKINKIRIKKLPVNSTCNKIVRSKYKIAPASNQKRPMTKLFLKLSLKEVKNKRTTPASVLSVIQRLTTIYKAVVAGKIVMIGRQQMIHKALSNTK